VAEPFQDIVFIRLQAAAYKAFFNHFVRLIVKCAFYFLFL